MNKKTKIKYPSDISESFQEYLNKQGKTLDEYVNELCDYLVKRNIVLSTKIAETIAEYLPPCAYSYDYYEVIIPRVFDKIPSING